MFDVNYLAIMLASVVAFVLAYFIAPLDITSLLGAIGVGLLLWIGFPLLLLIGSVMHEKEPGKLAAIHAGDWLIKVNVH